MQERKSGESKMLKLNNPKNILSLSFSLSTFLWPLRSVCLSAICGWQARWFPEPITEEIPRLVWNEREGYRIDILTDHFSPFTAMAFLTNCNPFMVFLITIIFICTYFTSVGAANTIGKLKWAVGHLLETLVDPAVGQFMEHLFLFPSPLFLSL